MNNTLDDIFKSIYHAIVNAQNTIEEHYVEKLGKTILTKRVIP